MLKKIIITISVAIGSFLLLSIVLAVIKVKTKVIYVSPDNPDKFLELRGSGIYCAGTKERERCDKYRKEDGAIILEVDAPDYKGSAKCFPEDNKLTCRDYEASPLQGETVVWIKKQN